MITDILFILVVGAFVGAASGYLGSFMVLKRMSLVGDALSHVALPGIALALTFGINPMLGAFTFLVISAFGIWYLSEKSDVYPESLVGIFFTASLSLGLLLTPEPELLEALFGDIDSISNVDGLVVLMGSIIIFIVTKIISKKLILGIVSEDLAKAQKVNISKINLIYLLLVSAVVALGVKFLGTLLTGAMVIIPAVIAKNLSTSIKNYEMLSIMVGVISTIVGILIAKSLDLSSGPIIVLVGIAIFIGSYIFKVR